jgi:dihydropteroate synthase
MGILNVTPDSFSDGGLFFSTKQAVERASEMIAEGADLLDIGPESTRPGSLPVSAEEQIARAVPVIEAVRAANRRIPISIDTRLEPVASAAIQAGVDMVNDVSALRDDPGMAGLIAQSGVAVILMHRRGTSATMQQDGGPHYEDEVAEIADFLAERKDFAIRGGIARDRILLDPGIGFGKRVGHNLQILRRLDRFLLLGQPVVLGISRKSFIGSIADVPEPARRDPGSLACAVLVVQTCHRVGTSPLILRIHDVKGTVQAIRVVCAVLEEVESSRL